MCMNHLCIWPHVLVLIYLCIKWIVNWKIWKKNKEGLSIGSDETVFILTGLDLLFLSPIMKKSTLRGRRFHSCKGRSKPKTQQCLKKRMCHNQSLAMAWPLKVLLSEVINWWPSPVFNKERCHIRRWKISLTLSGIRENSNRLYSYLILIFSHFHPLQFCLIYIFYF